MNNDVRTALRHAAAVPLRAVDYDEIAQTAKRRQRRARVCRAAGAVASVMIVVGVALAVRPTGPDGGSEFAEPTHSGTAARSGMNSIRVPGLRAGEDTRFEVTFLDGSVAELTVAPTAALDTMPVRPGGGARLPGIAERDFVVPLNGIAWFASLGTKTRELARTDSKVVSLWSVARPDGGPSRYLSFEFGTWVIGVWDGAGGSSMRDADLQTWADNLDARTTGDGFLVLTPKRPLELLGPGSGAPPALTWGSDDDQADGLTVRRAPCGSDVDDASVAGNAHFRTMCRPAWNAHVEIYGSGAFADSAAATIEVRFIL